VRSIAPRTAPGGLVFILYDEHDAEVDRLAATSLATDEAAAFHERAARHAEHVLASGGYVVVFDGDSGAIVGALGVT
jgi:hypothetical protein